MHRLPSPLAHCYYGQEPGGDPKAGLCDERDFGALAALGLRQSALARPLGVSHIFGTMREILPGIFTWGSTYADRPWDLNGYAIRLDGCTVLVDPPAPGKADWPSFDHKAYHENRPHQS